MKRVMMVSKPLRPPWSDSSKNLVKDVVTWSERTHYALMGDAAHEPDWPRVRWDRVYRDGGRYAPGLSQNVRAFGHLLRPDAQICLFHFFFAPNPVTSAALRSIMALRRQPTVHSVCSVPRSFDGVDRMLFADVVIALSDWTAHRLREAGVPDVRHIPPGIDPGFLRHDPSSDLPDRLGVRGRPVVLFAGDYEVGGGAELLVESLPHMLAYAPDVMLVLACRMKTAEAKERERSVQESARAAGLADRIIYLNEVDEMGDLLGLATVAALPVTSTYRKMDIPLVLLEAMAFGVPVVVSESEPIRETVQRGGGLTVPPGEAEALGATIGSLLADETRRKRIGSEGISAVERFWHIRRTASSYEDVYDQLLNRSIATP